MVFRSILVPIKATVGFLLSVLATFGQASRVVVVAAIIMVSVFAGFIFTHDIMIKQIGFALALGILIDAFALVQAVMALFVDTAKWLDRLLPNLDIEGDKLIAKLNDKNGAENYS